MFFVAFCQPKLIFLKILNVLVLFLFEASIEESKKFLYPKIEVISVVSKRNSLSHGHLQKPSNHDRSSWKEAKVVP